MIEQKLTTYFKRYATITPRAEFLARSRMSISAQVQLPLAGTWFSSLRESVTTGSALALASFLLLLIVGGVSYISKQSGQLATTSSFNNDSLTKEAALLTFHVQLKDAEYFDESASQVVRALDQIANETTIQ